MRRALAVAGVLWTVFGGAARGYPIAEERKLGDRFSVEAAGTLPVIREPAVVDYVSRIGQRIVDHLDPPRPFTYRFTVLRDPELNAFAVPGGFVYLNSGLLLRVGNESELAGVLGHEIGHVHAHHIVRQEEKTRFLNYAALAGMLLSMVHPAIGVAAMGANATAQLSYQREFEREADYLGLRYMRAAGYDPHGMLGFMKRLWNEQRTLAVDELPPYLKSHPMTEERIDALEAATKDLPEQAGWKTPTFALERAQTIVRAITGEPSHATSSPPASSSRARALSGITRLYQGDAKGALEVLESARRDGVPGLESDIGLARVRTGDLDGAVRALREAVEVDPQDGVARARLGKALLEKGDYSGAIRELSRAEQLAPELDEMEYDLGQAYGHAGEVGKGFFHLARSFEMRGEIVRARAQYEKAIQGLAPGAEETGLAQERIAALEEMSEGGVFGR